MASNWTDLITYHGLYHSRHFDRFYHSNGIKMALFYWSLIRYLSSHSSDLQHVSLADEAAAWTSPEDIYSDRKGIWLCRDQDQRTQRKFRPILAKRLHRLLPHRDGRRECFYLSVFFFFLFVFYNEICHAIPDTLVSPLLLIEGGQRFWFWYKEFECLHFGPVYCWKWNDHHYFTLGTAVHDLLSSHTRCVWVISVPTPACLFSKNLAVIVPGVSHRSVLYVESRCVSCHFLSVVYAVKRLTLFPVVTVCRESPGRDRHCHWFIQTTLYNWQRGHALH